MSTIQDLEKEIDAIKERNRRVEREKAWEVSWTRKVMIVFLTYIVIAIFFMFVGTVEPLLDAIVPSIAFILSTLSAPFIKQWWLKHIHKG
ncbi:MAG: hypothetical protein AAB414_02895 [Patescibacteria group bacterium]